jgi:bifunctional DNase/RNase
MRQIILVLALTIGVGGVGAAGLYAQQKSDAVEVEVDDLQATPYGISITLRARSGDVLHMLIGISEGEAIARALSHNNPPRPMTHDLITTILGRTGWHVQRVLIRGISGSTFLADLVLERNGETEVIDSRPSDAMALAVRSNARIFVNPDVFEMERRREERELQQRPQEEGLPPAGESIRL